METIRESIAIAEPLQDEEHVLPTPAPRGPAASSREDELTLQIRLTASRLIGIALMGRPDPEHSR
jgi:hypothetical protein